MKKILIIIIFLFLLSGCNNRDEEYYVERVDILNDYNTDENKLELNFYTTNEYDNIKCIIEDETIEYAYNIESNVKKVKIDNKKLYQHILNMEFKNEVSLDEIIMDFNNKLYRFDIGKYESKRIITGVNDYIKLQPIYNLNEDVKEVELRISNLSRKQLNFHTIKNLNKSELHVVKTIKAKDVMVGINETVISESLLINDKLPCKKMSTYMKYEYSYETDRINNNYLIFKLEYNKDELEMEYLVLGKTLVY